MPIDLSVEFCGVKFKNPFILAASPASRVQQLPVAVKAGWAGAVTWTAEVSSNVEPGKEYTATLFSLPYGVKIGKPPSFWSFQCSHHEPGFNLADPYPSEKLARVVRMSKEHGLPIIANIRGGGNIEYCAKGAVAAEKAGADMIELNPSYAIRPKVGMHLGFHRDLEKTRTLIKAVKAKTSIPVMVKLNAFLIPQELKDWAKACVEGGADAISITNSMPGISGVDVETGMPLTAYIDDTGKFRGAVEIVTGPATRPINLAAVALVNSAVDVPIVAIGGVADWHDAVEYIMLGASAVEIASSAIAYGHSLIHQLTRGLGQFMKRKGYSSIQDFVGITNKKYMVGELVTHPGPGEIQPRMVVVDEALCDGCGLCLPPCRTGGGNAIRVVDKIAKIDDNLCLKCNLCVFVCPQDAIRIEWEPSYLE